MVRPAQTDLQGQKAGVQEELPLGEDTLGLGSGKGWLLST
jgi:hypothetical protein